MPHEPKRRHSKARKRTRRAAISLDSVSLIVCTNCKAKTMAHMACRSCGYYAGKTVTEVKKEVKVQRV